MSKVAVITDSTAYIPDELLKAHSITVAPQVLIWGEETFRDGVDIMPDDFYKRLETAKVMPTTSQVAIVDMKTAFEKLLDKWLRCAWYFYLRETLRHNAICNPGT